MAVNRPIEGHSRCSPQKGHFGFPCCPSLRILCNHSRSPGKNSFGVPTDFMRQLKPSFKKGIMSVLIVGVSYGARNVLFNNRRMVQNFLAFRDSHIIPLRRSPTEIICGLLFSPRGERWLRFLWGRLPKKSRLSDASMKLHLIQLAQKSLLMSYFTRFLDEKSDSQRRRGPERFDFHL